MVKTKQPGLFSQVFFMFGVFSCFWGCVDIIIISFCQAVFEGLSEVPSLWLDKRSLRILRASR